MIVLGLVIFATNCTGSPSITMISMFKEEYFELSIFRDLTAEQIRLLCTILDYCHFSEGLVIFDQGQTATNLYILLSGAVMVNYKPYDGPPLVVADSAWWGFWLVGCVGTGPVYLCCPRRM